MTLATPETAFTFLREKGFRLTKGRRAVVNLLLGDDSPLSVNEVLERLKKRGTNINRVTAYRELAFLEEMGLVESVQFEDGMRRYARAGGHRHHLICTSCKTVEAVELPHDLDVMEKRIRQQTDFTIDRHELEFYGRCRKCA
jgi:Fur family transcriptional regulator, ferric uptake regulator